MEDKDPLSALAEETNNSLSPIGQAGAVGIVGILLAMPITGMAIEVQGQIVAATTDSSGIKAGEPAMVLGTALDEQHCDSAWGVVMCSRTVFNKFLIVEQCPGRLPAATDLPHEPSYRIQLGKIGVDCVIDRVQVTDELFDALQAPDGTSQVPAAIVFDGPVGGQLPK
jgi:hypothetical protein